VLSTPFTNTIRSVIGFPLFLYCTSEGSPPDTFTWMKDGIPLTHSTFISKAVHSRTSVVFHSFCFVNSLRLEDIGTYTCTVTNPIGSDSKDITVALLLGKLLIKYLALLKRSHYIVINVPTHSTCHCNLHTFCVHDNCD